MEPTQNSGVPLSTQPQLSADAVQDVPPTSEAGVAENSGFSDASNQQTQSASQQMTDTELYGYQESNLIPGLAKPQKEELLVRWEAPSRPFKKHNRQYYSTVGVIAGLIALILFFAGQVLPVAVVIAVVFLIYIMNSIEPGIITYQITTYGVRIENELYYWEELGRFWIQKKHDQNVLYIEVYRFPNRLTLMLADLNVEGMTQILSEILLNEQPPPTSYEKAARWLHEKIPIDLES